MAAVRKKQAGQTLVEMVIAIGLVSFILVGLVAGAIVSLKTSRLARERNVANQLATTQLEKARQDRDNDPATFFATTDVARPVAMGTNPAYQVKVTKTLAGDQMEVVVE